MEHNTDALNWLKNHISKVNSGSVTVEQSFSFGERKIPGQFWREKDRSENVSTWRKIWIPVSGYQQEKLNG